MTSPSDDNTNKKLTLLLGVLDRAVKAVPAARYFWGVIALSVVVAFISLFNGLSRLTFVATVAAFVTMILFYIFSCIEKTTDPIFKLLGYAIPVIAVLAFAFVITTSAWLALNCTPRLMAHLYGVSDVCYPINPQTPPALSSQGDAMHQSLRAPQVAPAPITVIPVTWGKLGFGYAGGAEPTFIDIEIGATITDPLPVKLRDAYIVSGTTGEHLPMMLSAGKDGEILPRDANPIPSGVHFFLTAKLKPPLSAPQVLSQWGKVYFSAEYGDQKYEATFDETYMMNKLSSFAGSPLAPHITKRPEN
jgi:hypothetical protein